MATTKTFRASAVTRRQLSDLAGLWGESDSAAITRCIERVWLQEFGLRPARARLSRAGGAARTAPQTGGQLGDGATDAATGSIGLVSSHDISTPSEP